MDTKELEERVAKLEAAYEQQATAINVLRALNDRLGSHLFNISDMYKKETDLILDYMDRTDAMARTVDNLEGVFRPAVVTHHNSLVTHHNSLVTSHNYLVFKTLPPKKLRPGRMQRAAQANATWAKRRPL